MRIDAVDGAGQCRLLLRCGGFGELSPAEIVACITVFFGIFSDVSGDLHRAESRAAHRAEVRGFSAFCREGFIMKIDRTGRIEPEGKLISPTEFIAGF